MICARLQPKQVVAHVSQVQGLVGVGDEYSIITSFTVGRLCLLAILGIGVDVIEQATQACVAMVRLRNPFTTL
jgi:hypothetical protein